MAPNGLEQKQTTSGRRPAILMGLLLVLLGTYLYGGQLSYVFMTNRLAKPPMHLEGKNSISGLVVRREKSTWIAEFDYFYTGDPQHAQPQVMADTLESGFETQRVLHVETILPPALLGAHHVKTPIGYAGDSVTTTGVSVRLWSFSQTAANGTITSQRVEQVIHWPDPQTWMLDQHFAKSTPEQNLAQAVALIDSEGEPQLIAAKTILEKLLEENAQLDAAYVELARLALKSNWNAEGLHQAESLLGSALKLRPDSANAKILLGYVYANQRHFAQAQALFVDAAASNPRNLWLWENWGELLEMEGKADQAIAKYREAIDRPMTHDTYDRARQQAYRKLLKLLQERDDFDAVEALYKKRTADFGPGACYTADYARFMLQVRGDTQSAIDLARGALNQSCEDSGAREVLGLAQYVKWATTQGPESAEALNQARVFLPAGAKPLYLLSASEHTVPALRHLIADGEKIDEKDNDNFTALAHALQNHDFRAAKRLLALGASPTTPVGYGDVPLALMPVLEEDLQGIRFLRQNGVDYSKLRYRGLTALEVARRAGKSTVLEALGGGGSAL